MDGRYFYVGPRELSAHSGLESFAPSRFLKLRTGRCAAAGLRHRRGPIGSKRSSKQLLNVTLAFLALTISTFSAKAWNHVGHRTIAELVWKQLSADEKKSASDLLKEHPHYSRILLADMPPGVSKEEWAFLSAAVWPDLIKHAKPGQPQKPSSITKYDLYPHAIGYPFVRPADKAFVSKDNFYIATPNAEMVLSNSLVTLANTKAAPQDRAVSLCWALHLFGDLHQPLHTATWVRRDKEGWDGLGGNYIVRETSSEGKLKQVDLHTFWDRLGGVDGSYKAIAAIAHQLETNPKLKPDEFPEYRQNQTIPAWVQEGHRIAVNFAYAEDRVQFVDIDKVHSGTVKDADIPILRGDYISEAGRIAQQRFVLAARRAADALKQIW